MYKIGDIVKIKNGSQSGDTIDEFPFPETILHLFDNVLNFY